MLNKAIMFQMPDQIVVNNLFNGCVGINTNLIYGTYYTNLMNEIATNITRENNNFLGSIINGSLNIIRLFPISTTTSTTSLYTSDIISTLSTITTTTAKTTSTTTPTTSQVFYSPIIQVQPICDGTSSSFSCTSGVIEIVSANYGRLSTNESICVSGRVSSVLTTALCFSNQTSFIGNLCNGQSSCSILSSKNFFTLDPCVLTDKYVSIQYKCKFIQTQQLQQQQL